MNRALVVYGTRPEAVKLAPVVRSLRASTTHEVVVTVTAQHRGILDQVNEVFGIRPDVDLDLMRPGQTLVDITARVLEGLTPVIDEVAPDVVVVQGDTTTTFSAALAAFYARVPVAHVEAGLRTGERYAPFPEEVNRRLTTGLSSLHLAPTPASRDNLLREDVAKETVVVTGNTVIDALHHALDAHGTTLHDDVALWPVAERAGPGRPIVLVTTHRRESWGAGMASIGRALAAVAAAEPDALLVLPVHPNPIVRDAVLPPLVHLDNVVVVEPLPYLAFARLLANADVVITDSGGVQEEAPSLGVPVLVLRDTTERPEAVDSGVARLVGTDEAVIVREALRLLRDPEAHGAMANAVSPFGDGRAAERCVVALAHMAGLGPPAEEFDQGARERPSSRRTTGANG